MEQPCSRCGYISDRPARFCRQCGSQLVVENEATSATTRNYAQQTPSQYAEPQTGYTPGSWAEQTPNTSQLYRPPDAPVYGQMAAPRKSGWVKWVLISLAAFFLLAVVAGVGIVYWASQKVSQAVEEARRDFPQGIPIPADPPAPPDELPVPTTTNATLDDFKYPGAAVVTSAKAPFTQTLVMTTSDDIEKVKEFYDKKFSEVFKNSDSKIQVTESEKYVYTSLTFPMMIITLEPDHGQDDKTKITLANIKMQAPNLKF